MKARTWMRGEVSICLPKHSAIFIILALAVLIFLLRHVEVLKSSAAYRLYEYIQDRPFTENRRLPPLETMNIKDWFKDSGGQLEEAKDDPASTEISFQHEVNSSIYSTIIASTSRASTVPVLHQSCTFQPLSPEDAQEGHLLDSIIWPETPVLPTRLSLEKTTDPAHSNFIILPPQREGGQWHVGDQLEVRINMYDFKGRPKKSGGDFLIARLHNLTFGAGVAGHVVDHLNGSYSAVFTLLWEGSAQVQVLLVHPSEAVTVLKRLDSEQPDRVYFWSLFRSGSVSETTMCNVCLRPTQQPLCNYTDLHTGEPWFCYKPKKLSCDTRINHNAGIFRKKLKAKEEKLFQSRVNMKVSILASGPANVTVLSNKKGQPQAQNSSVDSGLSGYYYQGLWRALDGTTVRQFNPPAITQCLKGKVVHMYGDSTVRQFFEYFNAALPGLKEFNLHSSRKVGPLMALDNANNILVTYRFHGPPVVSVEKVFTSELRYIANELDGLRGGTDTVVVFGVWAHFACFPMEVYIHRLQSIRRAVVRLLDRAPGTLVIIRTGNLRAMTLDLALIFSDWFSLQRVKVLRAMFKGLNVHLVDAWEMTLAHHLPHNIHPLPPIVKNMINIILSHICPQKGLEK